MDTNIEMAEQNAASPFLERLDGSREPGRNAVVLHAPRGAAAERYRLLDFRLGQLARERQLKTLGVASALGGEGRSTTALNLALSAARAGDRRVALVDADLRRPAIERMLGLPPGPGLSELLAGEGGLEGTVRRLQNPSLWVVSAGRPGPDQAVAATRLRRILGLLGASFDCVFVDMPPILDGADAALVSSICDGVLLVVRPRRSAFGALEDAAGLLGSAKVVGCVLNDAEGLLEQGRRSLPNRVR